MSLSGEQAGNASLLGPIQVRYMVHNTSTCPKASSKSSLTNILSFGENKRASSQCLTNAHTNIYVCVCFGVSFWISLSLCLGDGCVLLTVINTNGGFVFFYFLKRHSFPVFPKPAGFLFDSFTSISSFLTSRSHFSKLYQCLQKKILTSFQTTTVQNPKPHLVHHHSHSCVSPLSVLPSHGLHVLQGPAGSAAASLPQPGQEPEQGDGLVVQHHTTQEDNWNCAGGMSLNCTCVDS